MGIRTSHYWLVPVLALACLVVAPPVKSQCIVNNTVTFTSPASPPTYPYKFIRITKTLAAATNCPDPTLMNAYGCGELPSNAAATKLRASAFTNTMNPFCNWACGCGTVTINSGDGLPVELMDFAIED